MAILLPKLLAHRVLELGPVVVVYQTVKPFLPDCLRDNSGDRLMIVLKAPLVHHLKRANYTDGAKLLAEEPFVVDLVAYLVEALLNEEDLVTLIKFFHHQEALRELSVLQGVQELNHEFTVGVILERIEWIVQNCVFIYANGTIR